MNKQNTEYEYLPEYYGKEKFGIFRVPEKPVYIFGIIVTLGNPIRMLFDDMLIYSAVYRSIIILAMSAVVIIAFFNPVSKIQFNNEGVRFDAKVTAKSKYFKWEDIKGVAISPAIMQKRIARRYIYFAVNNEEINRIIRYDTDVDNIIFARYRPKMIHCIRKYYKGEIRELDKMKSWERYIDRLR